MPVARVFWWVAPEQQCRAAGGLISADSLIVNAGGAAGVGSSDAPLQTAVNTLRSAADLGSVHISNSGDSDDHSHRRSRRREREYKWIADDSFSSVCDCTPGITGSSVVLAASGSMLLNVDADITATNEVALYAGYDAVSGTYASDGSLTVDANVSGSTVGLFAGGEITNSGTLTGVVTETPSLYSAAAVFGAMYCDAWPAGM